MSNQYQPELDFAHFRDNNPISQTLLDKNRVTFGKDVLKVLRLLADGNTLTVIGVLEEYKITSLPRRILDIEEKWNICAKRSYKKPATYWFEESQIIRAKEILNKLNKLKK